MMAEETVIQLRGQQPRLLITRKAEMNTRVKKLPDARFVTDNQTAHLGWQVCGSLGLVAFPGEKVGP